MRSGTHSRPMLPLLQPLSASSSSTRGNSAPSEPDQPIPPNRKTLLNFLHWQRAQPPASHPSDSIPLQSITDSCLPQLDQVQLAFLVAMPSPDPLQPHAHHHEQQDVRNDYETKLPDIQLGLLDVPVKDICKPEPTTETA